MNNKLFYILFISIYMLLFFLKKDFIKATISGQEIEKILLINKLIIYCLTVIVLIILLLAARFI
ncbi:MAG: hypothetical protein B6I26_04765 [Desulfobacteraceae bacterium 4572_130]|nr:MAG: hypothetical protein B6I26_04765 [Desulfobacteraceae bacterium 4572_130]